MDKLKAFFEAMTLWNWLALIAFLIALFSGLNAFLSLRSRYRDWKGTRNKKEFEKRIKRLREKLRQLEEYKKNPTEFFIRVSSFIIQCLTLLLLSIACFNVAFLLERLYTLRSGLVMFGIAILWTLLGIIASFRLVPLIIAMKTPGVLAMEIIEFVRKGFKKGLATEDADELVVSLAFSEMFTGTNKEVLFNYIGEKYPQILSTIMARSKTDNQISA
jgi:MFS family permease